MTENKAMREEGKVVVEKGGVQCMTWKEGASRRRSRLLLFDGLFRRQGILLLRLRLLQLGLVKGVHLRNDGLVAHGCR